MTKWLLLSTLALAACASDEGGGGGGDMLPKRGERTEDPTIVSATARCSCGGDDCGAGSSTVSHIRVRIDASDSKGGSNLGSCSSSIGGLVDQGEFTEDGECSSYIATPCAPGSNQTIDITVANETGGVTTASVSLTVTQ